MAAQRQVKKKGRPTARIESDRLEARLRELERLFEDLKSGHASLSSFSTASSSSGSHAVPSQAPSRTPSPSPPSTGTLPAEFTPTLEENVAKLSSGLDNLELDIKEYMAQRPPTPRQALCDDVIYLGPSSIMHQARFGVARSSQPRIEPSGRASLVERALQTIDCPVDPIALRPPPDLETILMETYFEGQNAVLPMLHRPTYDRALEGGRFDNDASFRSLYFAICAHSARYVADPRIPSMVVTDADTTAEAIAQSKGFPYFRIAYLECLRPFAPEATVFSLQASVICIQWLTGTSSLTGVYSAIGVAMRRAIHVGAHREHQARWRQSNLEDQLRRRAVFGLIGQDRATSNTLGRPCALQLHDSDLMSWSNVDDASLEQWDREPVGTPAPRPPSGPSPTSGWAMIGMIQKVIAKATVSLHGLKELDEPAKIRDALLEADGMMKQWLVMVPQHLRWDPDQPNRIWLVQAAMIHAMYYGCQILVHRNFVSPDREPLTTLPSLSICSNAARSCCHIIDTLRRRGQLEISNYWAPYHCGTAALTLLCGIRIMSQREMRLTTSALADVKLMLTALDELAATTFFARKLHTGLARLYRAAAREYRAPPPSTPPQQKRGLDDRQSEEPVPQASASEHVYKRPKPNDQVDEAQALPLTTNDLSFELFFGQPTWQTPFPSSVFPAVEPDQEPWSQGAGPWHSHPAGNTASEVPSDSGGPDAPWTSAPPAVAGQLNHLAWAGIDSESQQWWNALFLPGPDSDGLDFEAALRSAVQ